MRGWVGGCGCPHRGVDHEGDGKVEGEPCTVPDCFPKVCKGWKPRVRGVVAPKEKPKSDRIVFTREERVAMTQRVRNIVDQAADEKTRKARVDWQKRHPNRRWGWMVPT